MEISMPEFCKRFSQLAAMPIKITWTSVVASSASSMPILKVTGLLEADGIYFKEPVPYYGSSRKFDRISEGERVTVFDISYRLVGGVTLLVETLV